VRTLSLTVLTLTLTLASVALSACGDKDDTATPEGDTDTDTDADGDTDSDADTDAGPCGPWTGISGLGTTWSYSFADADLSGTVDNEITAYDAGAGLVTAESLSDLTGPDYTLSSTTTTEYRCDGDGYWMLSQHTEYAMDYAGTPIEGWTDASYDPPALLIPHDIQVGDSWTTSYIGTTETNMSAPAPFESSVVQTVIEEQSVTVPAGTYDTLYVEFSGDGEGWSNIARGVGQVKSNVTVLTSYQP
jgi:hypothetical protein